MQPKARCQICLPRALKMVLLVPAIAACLAACGSRPQGVLAPIPNPIPQTAKVDLLVATTRAPSQKRGVLFTGERGDGLYLANVVVSIPNNRKPGTIQWPNTTPGNPERSFVTTLVEPVKATGVRAWFTNHAVKGRRVLIFVHGFNTRFDAAVFRYAQIVHDSHADVAPVLFSWPSRGALLDYNYDRESINFSRTELAYVIEQAVASPDVREITIMAHSLGSWAAMEALRDIALQDGRISPKVTDVVLASPDLDIDVFRKQLLDIGPERPHFSIFVSASDRALRVSRLLSGRVTRVGAADLTQARYKAMLEQSSGITVFDLTALSNGDALSHSQFATSPEVVRLLGERLLEGQPISDTSGGGQLTAAAVDAGRAIGSATGAALSAPIRILESASQQ